MSNWQTIWENKGQAFSGDLSLAQLIKYDGFDTGYVSNDYRFNFFIFKNK